MLDFTGVFISSFGKRYCGHYRSITAHCNIVLNNLFKKLELIHLGNILQVPLQVVHQVEEALMMAEEAHPEAEATLEVEVTPEAEATLTTMILLIHS